MNAATKDLILPTMDPKGSEALRRVLETNVASFDDMDVAVGLLTKMMGSLMTVRERILIRMRETGQLR
jgi:hypothetical protein